MRTKMTPKQPEVALNRVLVGLEKELVEASDEEIVQAAAELGMNVKMKGSAAFIGVKYTFPRHAEDIFEAGELRKFYAAAKGQRRPRSYLPKAGRKNRDDDEKK